MVRAFRSCWLASTSWLGDLASDLGILTLIKTVALWFAVLGMEPRSWLLCLVSTFPLGSIPIGVSRMGVIPFTQPKVLESVALVCGGAGVISI